MKELIQRNVATLRAIEAELAPLQAGGDPLQDFVALNRTDAIVAVLRETHGSMSPSQIREELATRGR